MVSCGLHKGGDGTRLHNLEGKKKFMRAIGQFWSSKHRSKKDDMQLAAAPNNVKASLSKRPRKKKKTKKKT